MRTATLALFALTSFLLLAEATHAQPLMQEAYLKPGVVDLASIGESFGASVAISGDTAVVGAPEEDSISKVINGDQMNNAAFASGAAYVFVRDGNGWSQQAYLKADNSDLSDQFGTSVAIDGDTIVVGALNESSGSSGVNGDGTDNSEFRAGAAYVFVRDGTTWTQQAYLKASNPGGTGGQFVGDRFGSVVAISGDTIVVGADLEDSATTGIDGDQNDESAPFAGAAYVFVRDGTSWLQQAYIKATNTGANDGFGRYLDIDGDTIAIAALGEDSSSSGVNGSQGGGLESAGAVYVFKRDGTTWFQQAYVKPSNPSFIGSFGTAVAIDGDTLAVGSEFEDGGSSGINGDQSPGASDSGAVYLFERNVGSWAQTHYVKASNARQFGGFGSSIALEDDLLVVGAAREASGSPGINGDKLDLSAPNSGALYVFVRDGADWSEEAYLKASNPDTSDALGQGFLGLSNGSIIAGADAEDSFASGVNGDQGNDTGSTDVGAAYIFDVAGLTYEAWSDEGCALFGATGDPLLIGSGPFYPGSQNSADLSNAAPSSAAGVFIGATSTPTLFKGGTLKPVPWAILAFTNTSPGGTLALPFTVPGNLPSGTELYAQIAIVDAGAPAGVALSNAVKAVTP